MTFVDTNYFLRFLINDLPEQRKKARDLFEKGSQGKVQLYTSVIVFFEIFWVFTSFYKKTKKEVVSILNKVLKLSFIRVENRELLVEALNLFESSNIELEDCYNVVLSKSLECEKFATFDKKVLKVF